MARWFNRPMTESEARKWEITRERGVVLFVLRIAFLGAIGAGFGPLISHFHRGLPSERLKSLLDSALTGAIAGAFGGIWEWRSKEKRYWSRINQQNSSEETIQVMADSSQRGTLNGKYY